VCEFVNESGVPHFQTRILVQFDDEGGERPVRQPDLLPIRTLASDAPCEGRPEIKQLDGDGI
jgi:hypothetical protein